MKKINKISLTLMKYPTVLPALLNALSATARQIDIAVLIYSWVLQHHQLKTVSKEDKTTSHKTNTVKWLSGLANFWNGRPKMKNAGLQLKGWKRRFSRSGNKNNKRMCQLSSLKAVLLCTLKKMHRSRL